MLIKLTGIDVLWMILIVLAEILSIVIAAQPARAQGQYGFTHPPYNYSDEYRENQWKCSEAHRYQPGYHRCSGDEWRHRRDREDD